MNPEKRNEDFLREASALGDEDGVRKLLEAGVDVNSQHSINGWTALHWAAKRGHPSIVRLLLSQGADSSLTSVYGESPLAVAKNEEIHNILSGNSELQTEFQTKPSLTITPNYLANPALAPKIDKKDKRNAEVLYSNNYPDSDSKRKFEEEIVLKVRVAESIDLDFIEIEVPLKDLTYENVCRICCEELEVPSKSVLKLRKLPNTIVRKDKDVLRFQNFQELELVLKPNGATKQQTLKTHFSDTFYQEAHKYTANNNNNYENNSDTSSPLVKKSNYCKNGTILY
ncbi:ankyrin repeat domain-containing protein 40-like isoform X1 [Argiope bruennichi]|uniref:ankyrin repeat domain-containing protein 40-like isoform X1 n=1 Tax=Argiope bruennichi TaxID=94029 RepID=UPI002493F7DF|nr:ankyrin repeat domain-containing protein 40-like isoform X1 [Argiope bruennichi]